MKCAAKIALTILATPLLSISARAQTVNRIAFEEVNGIPYIQIHVSGRTVTALVDSGANRTSVDSSVVQGKGCIHREILVGDGRKIAACERTVELTIGSVGFKSTVDAYGFPAAFGQVKVILSLRDLAQNGTVTFDYKNRTITVTNK